MILNIPIFPKDNPHQKLRIQRYLAAFGTYIVFYLLVIVLQLGGLLRETIAYMLVCIAVHFVANLAMYAIFRSEFNLRFKDPSLTLLQMSLGIGWIMFFMYFFNVGRSILLILFFVVFVFGLFRLRSKEFLFLSFLSIALYALVVFLLYLNYSDTVNLKLEIINLVVLTLALPWFSFFGGYVTRLRRQLKEALATIQKLAIYDELTQIYNRRHFLEMLRYQKSLHERGAGSFSLCILDLDHFKNVNDTYGHLAGDKVLQVVAKAVESSLRDTDTLGRYGGEEFVVLLAGAEGKHALMVTERIRSVVENLKIPSLPDDFKISTSIGLSTFQAKKSLEELIQCADEALYKAKSEGRNRVVFQAL